MTESEVLEGKGRPDAEHASAATVAISAAETERLLVSDPPAAAARARELLAKHPDNVGGLLLLGAALRRQAKFDSAREVLEALTHSQPSLVLGHFELGVTLGALGRNDQAVCSLSRAVDLMPNFAGAWYAIAEQLHAAPTQPYSRLHRAWDEIRAGNLLVAEAVLRDIVGHAWDEPAAFLLSIVRLAQEKGRDALPMVERLSTDDPENPLYRDLRAATLFQVEDFAAAISAYEAILNDSPNRPGAWMAYGRALRALGRREQCIAAFRRAIALLPDWIEARRTLASVKTYRLGPDEVAALSAMLARADLPAMSYAELHFALGRALEDIGRYGESFDNYQKSAALQRANIPYSAETAARFARREMDVFTPALFRERIGWGCQTEGPIFVVGMPRAGSTLVQEILCAHSAIERTGELRDLTWMVSRLDADRMASGRHRYPEVLRSYDNAQFAALGEEYLRRTLPRRKLSRPFFVDKYPGNFVRAGLIHLMLPNAKIIDVRRHPLDCCLSCFKQYFPEGPPFTHSLTDLGRYYADYVEIIAHFDRVLPGKVHRVFYEKLVENPEQEARNMLDYLGLPFEEQCLRYHERELAVMTTSTEQVRVAINKSGVGTWKSYETWLGPLKSALGRVLDLYPEVPKFYPPMQLTMTVRLA